MSFDHEAAPDYAIVFANEQSSNAARVAREIADLHIATKVISTRASEDHIIDAVEASPGDSPVIFAAGGDGTASLVGNAIMSQSGQEANLPDIPFVPLRGGNANDLAHMLNGGRSARQILNRGRQAGFYPLKITIGNNAPRYAFSYFSAGATAAAAASLDETRELTGIKKALAEVNAVWRATLEYPAFRYKTANDQLYVPVTDVTCVRGSRIAKYGRTGTKLDADTFRVFIDDDITPSSMMFKMARLATRTLTGDDVEDIFFSFGAPVSREQHPTRRAPLAIQLDGEVTDIRWSSKVSVAIASRSYTALTTKY